MKFRPGEVLGLQKLPPNQGQVGTGQIPLVQRLHGITSCASALVCGKSHRIAVSAVNAAQQVDHLNGRHGRLGTLVTRLGTRTLDGLLNGIDCQYAKGNRDVMIQ